MSDKLTLVQEVSSVTRPTADGGFRNARGTRDGAMAVADWAIMHALEGRQFGGNVGVGTTPATFAGAYDADGPDAYLYVPSGTLVIPTYLMVKYEAIGTESEMEVIGLVSATGDSSVTGTASTIYNMRTDAPISSNCTLTGAVDATGVTDPNAGNRIEFWRRGHPLADTPATGENDRNEHVYEWVLGQGPVPVCVGEGSLAIYASGQASTGFIIMTWIEVPSNSVV